MQEEQKSDTEANSGSPMVMFSNFSSSGSKIEVGVFHQTCCPICLEDFSETNPALVYPCGHTFHLQCAEEWHQRCESCPVCMKNALTEGRVMCESDIKQKREGHTTEPTRSNTPSSTEGEELGLLVTPSEETAVGKETDIKLIKPVERIQSRHIVERIRRFLCCCCH